MGSAVARPPIDPIATTNLRTARRRARRAYMSRAAFVRLVVGWVGITGVLFAVTLSIRLFG